MGTEGDGNVKTGNRSLIGEGGFYESNNRTTLETCTYHSDRRVGEASRSDLSCTAPKFSITKNIYFAYVAFGLTGAFIFAFYHVRGLSEAITAAVCTSAVQFIVATASMPVLYSGFWSFGVNLPVVWCRLFVRTIAGSVQIGKIHCHRPRLWDHVCPVDDDCRSASECLSDAAVDVPGQFSRR